MRISLNTAISGVKAALTRQEVSANNVANMNTPGFEQKNAIQTDMKPQGTRIAAVTRTPNPDRATSNTDLAKEAVEIRQNKIEVEADARVIKVQDRMIKDTIDLFA